MNPSNYPPGVTGSEKAIQGDEAWEKLFEGISKEADEEGMTDMDVLVSWKLGLTVWRRAKFLGATFPHD